jgi:hypothetical protein
MLFFQGTLVLGYLYAHRVGQIRQPIAVRLQTAILISTLAFLPALPSERWKPLPSDQPQVHVLLLLSCVIGLPFLQLASTSTLLQATWNRMNLAEQPYSWYAISNAGSLIGLLSYPIVVEPAWTLHMQASVWSAAYVIYAILMFAILFASRVSNAEPVRPQAREPFRWSWILISSATSMLLLGATSYMSENIAPMPLTWVIPLAVYLLSLVAAFATLPAFGRGVCALLGTSGLLILCVAALDPLLMYRLPVALALVSGGLFLVCVSLHRELYLRRPPTTNLTRFYVSIAAGGALGSAFVAILSPLTIPIPIDFVIGLIFCAITLAILDWNAGGAPCILSALAGVVVLYVSHLHATALIEGNRHFSRNFYGTLRTRNEKLPDRPFQIRLMTHGLVHHGSQILDPRLRRIPTTYYGYGSGASIAIKKTAHSGQRVGVVGLGTGTLAAYARAGDFYRFYELNPAVVRLAKSEFTYLSDSPANVDILVGDGRLSLEREPPQNFDVLLLDAFSSDAVPAHLLTREAMAGYLRHLSGNGILAVNVTNRALDLESVIAATAPLLGLNGCTVRTGENPEIFRTSATWVLLSRDGHACEPPSTTSVNRAGIQAWTDEFTSIWPILQNLEE